MMTMDELIVAEQRHLQNLEDSLRSAGQPGSIMSREVAEAAIEGQRAKVDALVAKRA